MNWVIGHIVASRDSALWLLGASPTWTEAEARVYKPNSEPVISAEQALPLTRLLSDLEASQARIMEALQHVSAETLAAMADEEDTVGQQITFSHWHETYHVGQLELLRQLAGKNDKVICSYLFQIHLAIYSTNIRVNRTYYHKYSGCPTSPLFMKIGIEQR